MARARAERARSKSSILEDISHGMERLQSFIPQIEDLGRDGFPYLEGARARTELQLKECIRKTFGEKSQEFQAYRRHSVSVDTPADTKQTVALIKSLIASLEDKKLEIQGLKPPPAPAQPPSLPSTPIARPPMALVPPSTTTAHVTITPAPPVTPPPVTMSVALTTNVDMTQASVVSPVSTPIVPCQPITAPESPKPQPTVSTILAPPAPSPLASQQNSAPDPASREAVHVSPVAKPIASPMPQPRLQEQAPAVVPVSDSGVATPASSVALETKSLPIQETTSDQTPQPTVSSQPSNDPCDIVKSLCKRFHLVARQLRLRGEYRATLDVEDEFDVQDLLHALLRLHFNDIETDEWLPSYSNGAPRIMFLLNDNRLAVVVKKTRTGLNAKDLADQFQMDVEHCRTLKRCSTLLCFVYDPEGRIGNPRGLEADLMSISDQLTADVYVAPK